MTTSRSRRVARRLAFVAVGGLAVLSLSGCLSMTANLDISSDAKTSGTFAIGVQKQAASMLGITDLDTFTSGINDPSMTGGSGDLLTTGDCVASETDTDFVYTCTFADTEFTGPDNPWTVTKSGDVITFHMVNKAASSDGNDLLGGGSLGQLTANVTFPGEITSVTGDSVTKNSDTTITVSAPMTQAVDVTVTSKSSGGGGALRTILIIAGIAVLAIIVIAVVLVLVMRGRGRETAPVAAGVIVGETVVAETSDGTAVIEDTAVIQDTVVAETPPGPDTDNTPPSTQP